jgi:hypothetical protein
MYASTAEVNQTNDCNFVQNIEQTAGPQFSASRITMHPVIRTGERLACAGIANSGQAAGIEASGA